MASVEVMIWSKSAELALGGIVTRRGGRRLRAGSNWKDVAPFCAMLLLVGLAGSSVLAKPKEPKPPAAAEYVGQIVPFSGTMFVIHIDSFTPDDVADSVALAGHDGDSNAIRAALGRIDAGFIKLGTSGYRVAFARRRVADDGVRITLILRNELEIGGKPSNQDVPAPAGMAVGRANGKTFPAPPLATVDVWLPSAGDGQAAISTAAIVVFRSADDFAITDWGERTLSVQGLRERKK